jgi:DNA invertase Pin-like site-specific DNA recombinase
LLFWALDRFSREGVVESLQHLERLKANGVQRWSFKEEFLRNIALSDAVLAILACIAKQERVRAAERVKAGARTGTSRWHKERQANRRRP